MKMIIILLLMIPFLTNCRTKIICRAVKSASIDSLPLCDVSVQFNRCRCRCFNINIYDTVDDLLCGENFRSGDHPVKYCEGLSGFFIEDWNEELKPKFKKLIHTRDDYCH